MKQNPIMKLDSVDAFNKAYGLPTLHPLVSVIDLSKATQAPNYVQVKYGLYAIYLKNDVNCTLRYGRQTYDYQEGTVVSFAPGKSVDIERKDGDFKSSAVGLLFHPDLIYGTPLGDRIHNYSFFDYAQHEAVHLSESERALFVETLDKIRRETEHPVDSHSADLISVNIQLLLEYLHRFYDRQFCTRHRENCSVVKRFEKELKRYFESGVSRDGLPSVAYFAEKVNLSPGYFGDLIKRELNSSAKDVIASHMVEVAKHRLNTTDDDISTIAYDLGFQYPQHFARQFKRLTGLTPTEYRRKQCS